MGSTVLQPASNPYHQTVYVANGSSLEQLGDFGFHSPYGAEFVGPPMS